MNYTVEKNDRAPAYLQLYRQVRDDIIKKNYPYNTKLPSKRTLADETGVSIVTAEHAYALLCDEGYVESRERSGYFVIFRTGDIFLSPSGGESERYNKRLLPDNLKTYPGLSREGYNPDKESSGPGRDLSAFTGSSPASPHDFPFSVLVKTMRSVINDFGENILDRSPNAGCPELRGAISRYLSRSRGISAEPVQIVIGSGAEYLYGLIVQLFGRERVYGIESPSYQKIQQVYQASDVKYEMLPLGNDGIESSALWASGADVLHISPYRSFPSGVSAPASKRHEYVRWADKGDRYIVEDDFESEFSVLKKPEETLFSLASGGNVIYMNTFSQTISPSLRVGYMVLPQRLVSAFEQKLGFYSCTVPTYIQYVLAELIDNGDFERHINRVRRRKIQEERHWRSSRMPKKEQASGR